MFGERELSTFHSSSSEIDIENPIRISSTASSNSRKTNLKRIDAAAEDHTTRDSIAVAQLSQDISKFYGFEAHYTNPESFCECILKWIWLCTGLDKVQNKLCPCFGKVKAHRQGEITMPLFWKIMLENEDYELIRWLKITGFPFHEGGSYQPEDTPEKDPIDEKLLKYMNITFNLMIKIKLMLFWVFGLIGFFAWIGLLIKKTWVFLQAFFTINIHVPPKCVVVTVGKGFVYFIVPAVQLFSIAWTMRKVTNELKCSSSILKYTVNWQIFADRLYEPCKKDSFNFFYTFMTALTVSLSWLLIVFTKTNVPNSFIKYVLRISFYFFFALNVIQYLALSMFFISISCKEVQKIQFDLLNLLDGEASYGLDNKDDIFHSFYKIFERVSYFVFHTKKPFEKIKEQTKYLSEIRI